MVKASFQANQQPASCEVLSLLKSDKTPPEGLKTLPCNERLGSDSFKKEGGALPSAALTPDLITSRKEAPVVAEKLFVPNETARGLFPQVNDRLRGNEKSRSRLLFPFNGSL